MSARLARWATRRPHAILAVAPAATAARLAVERELAALGGVVAVSAADADVLIVVGEPGDDLSAAIENVWRQLPGPRARAQILSADQARQALAVAVLHLGDEQQVREAAQRRDEWRPTDPAMGNDKGGHGDGGMQMPAGLMMADRGPDRDGLKLDVLQVPWGPVLADWPAGLVVDLTLQGDLVQRAEARVMPPAGSSSVPFWDADAGAQRRHRHAAAHLDSLGRLLAVAGWPGMAERVRRLRDGVLADGSTRELREELSRTGRRVRRARTLRWATDGLGVLTDDLVRQAGVSGPAARSVANGGDVTARWQCWLAEAERLLQPDAAVDEEGPRGRRAGDRPASAALLEAAQHLMAGVDVAAARLVLASFDPDPDELLAVTSAQVDD
ncbi:hypothetical protein [Actinoplanes sp. NPDC026619]|uniref:hypothetical protein n=1 Tax=Actinoplanes sp. NPDC026619 TaxID=3155798 RepID=UPI0033FEF008